MKFGMITREILKNTLLHEMIHLFCATNNIKDTSRTGTYHNKNFKNECLKRGFYFSDDKPHKTYGWAFPKITDETKELIKTFDINEEAFLIARKPPGVANEEESGQEKSESTGRKKSFKWICPGCTLIIRSTKEDINVMCGDCKEHLILCE